MGLSSSQVLESSDSVDFLTIHLWRIKMGYINIQISCSFLLGRTQYLGAICNIADIVSIEFDVLCELYDVVDSDKKLLLILVYLR